MAKHQLEGRGPSRRPASSVLDVRTNLRSSVTTELRGGRRRGDGGKFKNVMDSDRDEGEGARDR